MGSSFSNLKATASGLNKSPPITAGPANAATTVINKNGVINTSADNMTLPKCAGISSGVLSTSPSGLSAALMILVIPEIAVPLNSHNAIALANITNSVLSSRDRATCPFFRASFRRLAVGCSVRSCPCCSSATFAPYPKAPIPRCPAEPISSVSADMNPGMTMNMMSKPAKIVTGKPTAKILS